MIGVGGGYRTLPGTLARIDTLLDDRPICLRPGCGTPTVPAISPWCQPECARLTADGRRQRTAGLLEEVRAVRQADELQPGSLDGQDRDLIGRLVHNTDGEPVARILHVDRDRGVLYATSRWADESQLFVEVTRTAMADDALEQRTAALGERAAAERKQRDQNRIAAAVRRWCGRA
jgi:hypothetical protein